MSSVLPDGKIRAYILDDERLARKRVRRLLGPEPDVEVVGESADPREAVQFLAANPVDLLFLDIQMPELNGFDVLDSLPAERTPVVIFVTAYDQHAVRAFEVHALDYLLKPFDQARFTLALQRARAHLRLRRQEPRRESLQALLDELRPRKQPGRFTIRTPDKMFFLRMDDIDWVEAADNYVCVHAGTDTHVLRETLSSVEARLDPAAFARIHRSAIVNLERVKELRPWFHGDYVVVLKNGHELTLSRSHRDRVLSLLNP